MTTTPRRLHPSAIYQFLRSSKRYQRGVRFRLPSHLYTRRSAPRQHRDSPPSPRLLSFLRLLVLLRLLLLLLLRLLLHFLGLLLRLLLQYLSPPSTSPPSPASPPPPPPHPLSPPPARFWPGGHLEVLPRCPGHDALRLNLLPHAAWNELTSKREKQKISETCPLLHNFEHKCTDRFACWCRMLNTYSFCFSYV